MGYTSRVRRLASVINWQALLSIAAGLALWEILSRSGLLPIYLFPGPSLVAAALYKGLRSGSMLPHLVTTLRHLAIGFACGSLAGLFLAALCSNVKIADRFVDPWINATLPLPQFALLPLYLMLFGAREWLPAAVAALGAFYSVFVSLRAGLLKTDPALLEAARSLGAGKLDVLTNVTLPSALPYLFVGMHLGALQALRLVIVVEAVLSMRGMGYMLWMNGELFRTEQYYAYIVLLAGVGIAMVASFKRLSVFFVPWTRVQDIDRI